LKLTRASRTKRTRAKGRGRGVSVMEIRKVLALRGPNVWARFPVLEAWAETSDSYDETPGGSPPSRSG
jgi:hypothetical protein